MAIKEISARMSASGGVDARMGEAQSINRLTAEANRDLEVRRRTLEECARYIDAARCIINGNDPIERLISDALRTVAVHFRKLSED